MDFDDFSDDEQYYKHRNQVLKYNSWRYSLQNAKNLIQVPIEPLDSPRKESPQKVSRQGVRGGAAILDN